jgi:hypothetical protein
LALRKCDEAFSRWFQLGRSRKQALEHEFRITAETVKERLLHGRNRRDVGGGVIENLGYSLSLWNGGKDCQDGGYMKADTSAPEQPAPAPVALV